MPVPKITADQFVTKLNTSILDRNDSHDVELGPIPDLITEPVAGVLEEQNDRIRTVSQLILLDEVGNYTDSDVEDFVLNEELIRNAGGRSSGTVIFSRASVPTFDLTVQQGYPIGTLPDESTGETVVFVTTETKTLPVASASSYYNLTTERYELEVAVQATVAGQIGEVAANRVNRPLRTLNGFDNVFNRNRTSSTVERETNSELLERYRIAIRGTQIGVKTGLELFLKGVYPDAGDILVVYPDDDLVTRSSEDSGAVDIFVLGSQSTSRSENQEFVGLEQLIVLDSQPVLSITSVGSYVEGTDYVFVQDAGSRSGSVRAQDGIKFIPGGSSPSVGTSVNINYQQDILIQNMQSTLDDPDNNVGGQDSLIRKSTQIDITMTARLIVLSGFSFTTIQSAVTTAILDFVNTLKLGDDVEESDIQAEVRQIRGVDNFIITILDEVGSSGVGDISIAKNEFARIAATDITITT